LEPFLEEPLPEGRELLAVEAVREEMRLLSDAPRLVRAITGPVDPSSFVYEMPETSAEVYAHTERILEGQELESLEDARELVRELRAWAKQVGLKTRELLHPLRLALTGQNKGPEIAYLFVVLGTQEARARIKRAREARLEVL
ncbi:MAG: hypothetical protein M3N18_06190, partial [Actinomycetota bacterium]|nr:hypothetical protein [Actinomycetota bacterium]